MRQFMCFIRYWVLQFLFGAMTGRCPPSYQDQLQLDDE